LSISAVGWQTGVPAKASRFYEAQGVPPAADHNDHRHSLHLKSGGKE
jgi:DNA-binding transcriptional MerR regulator